MKFSIDLCLDVEAFFHLLARKWLPTAQVYIFLLTFLFDDVRYHISETLEKIIRLRHFVIFQSMMLSESGFRINKGLENGNLDNFLLIL